MKKFKELLHGNKVAKVMGVHNGLTAKLAEEAGYDAVWASGLEISASQAVPDANILTMSENLQVVENIRESTKIPVLCDCDSGYGGLNNTVRMVEKYENVGVDAICIEDKLFPKMNSFIENNQVLADRIDFCEKIRSIKITQENPDFCAVARIESLIAGEGMQKALERAELYEKAGADALLIHSKAKDTKEIKEFAKGYMGNLPLIIVPTTYPDIDLNELYKLGIRMVIFANQGLRSAVNSIKTTFDKIIEFEKTTVVEDEIAPMSEIFRLQGMYDMLENERKIKNTLSKEGF